MIGRDVALQRRGRDNAAVFSLGALPLVLALEALVPNEASIQSQQSIDIAASPAQVWSAVTSSAPLETPAPLPIRLSLAYPLSSELRGAGVGAQRIGRFSTGLAEERVTVWQPERQLAFQVLTTPPSMRELSPWPTVHAPHVSGYFQTDWTSFDITPLPGGRCRLTLRNASRLRMDPAPYWEPMARWAIRANGRRVLNALRIKAERRAA